MSAIVRRASRLALAALALSSCNDQFDFDTTPLDSGAPIDTVLDGAPDDSISSDVSVTDGPAVGVHISCGADECSTPACCSTQTGFACVDIGDGGTCSGLTIQCDDTEDCPAGQVCCAEGDDLGSSRAAARDLPRLDKLQRVHCEPEAHCRNSSYVILCNPDRPSPCTQCVASLLTGLPPGYHQCAAVP